MEATNTWFEEWFNTKYYHLLYNKRDNSEAAGFIDNLVSKLAFRKGATILDAACGRGRHSIYLHSLGFDVCGVDIAEQNIQYANQFAEEGLEFLVHDLRNAFYINYFDVVVNLFTSMGYFDESHHDERMVRTFAQSLKNKGICVIDFLNANKVIQDLKPSYHMTIDGVQFDIRKRIENGTVYKQIDVTDGTEVHHYQEKVRLLTLNDFEKMFSLAGLKIINLYGDYDLNTYDAASSNRLILVTQKQS